MKWVKKLNFLYDNNLFFKVISLMVPKHLNLPLQFSQNVHIFKNKQIHTSDVQTRWFCKEIDSKHTNFIYNYMTCKLFGFKSLNIKRSHKYQNLSINYDSVRFIYCDRWLVNQTTSWEVFEVFQTWITFYESHP